MSNKKLGTGLIKMSEAKYSRIEVGIQPDGSLEAAFVIGGQRTVIVKTAPWNHNVVIYGVCLTEDLMAPKKKREQKKLFKKFTEGFAK